MRYITYILIALLFTNCSYDDINIDLDRRAAKKPKRDKGDVVISNDAPDLYVVDFSNYTIPTVAPLFNWYFTQTEFDEVKTVRFSEYRHRYATKGVWNLDETFLMLDRKIFFNDSYYAGIDNGQLHWSKMFNNIQYGVWNNRIVKLELNLYNGTKKETYPFIFDDYQEIKLEGGHNETSLNDIIALHGRKFANDNVWIVRYNPTTNTYTEHELDFVSHLNDYNKTNGLRWIKMSPNGRYEVIGYYTDGYEKYQGVWVYDNETSDYYQITHDRSHSDVGQLKNGTQVYVAYQNVNSWEYSMVVFNISNGEVINKLLPNDMSPRWGHVSMRNYKELGYAFITLDGSNQNALDGDASQIILKVDLETGIYESFGRTYNDANNYNEETMGSPSPSGKEVGFASKWGGTTETNFYISSK